jgi:L-iditol 2-dehydrogenase
VWAYNLTSPRHFEKVDLPAPDPGDLREGQLVIRTLAGAVCGSDLAFFAGHPSDMPQDKGPYVANFPGFPMHEVVGEVISSRSPLFTRGMRVVGWAEFDNGLSEFLITRDDRVAQVDEDLEPSVAVLIQTLCCVIYAVDQIGDVAGRSVAILGQGPIGMLFAHVLKSRGARHVTGVDLVDRRDLAPAFGVDEVVHGSASRWAAQLTDDVRPELVIEAIGHQALTIGDAIEAAAPGGRIYYFGIPEARPVSFDLYRFLRKSLTLSAGTTKQRRQYLEIAREYLKSNPQLAGPYVTHTFDVSDAQRAYETAIVPAPGRLKVTLRMA